VYELAVRVTAPLRLTEAVRDKGREQLGSLTTAAMLSGRVAVMMKEPFGGVEVCGAKKRHCAAGSGGGPLGTLLLLDAATCATVAFFLPSAPFLVTSAQVCSWGCGGSETVKPGGGPVWKSEVAGYRAE